MPPFPDRELTAAEIVAAMDGRLHVQEPGRADAFLPSPVVQNHAANLALLADGSLACVWFGGTMEGMGDISVWSSVLAPGSAQWSPARKLSDDAGRSEQNPVLFTAPDGRLWLFHTSQPGGRQDECEIVARVSEGGLDGFGPPRRVGGFRGVFIRQPLRIGPQGEWLMPGFRCITPAAGRWTGSEDDAVMLVSRDGGDSWEARAVPGSLGAVHMNPVPGGAGAMPAFYRDRFARQVLRSRSADGGLTWSAPELTELPNNNSSIQAVRLDDGRIAMVLNPVNAEMSEARRASLYDEIEGEETGETAPSAAVWGVPRAPMLLAVSADDGETFPLRIELDRGTGAALSNNSREGLNRELSYPSILQDAEGNLHVAFTYHRRAIRHVRLDADWIGRHLG